MKNFSVGTLLFSFLFVSASAYSDQSKTLVVFGKIPGQYLQDKYPNLRSSHPYVGAVTIQGRQILNVQKLSEMEPTRSRSIKNKIQYLRDSGIKVIVAKTGNVYDTIYPGLIDLHGHNKQNVLPTWGHQHEHLAEGEIIGAKGQFANRHEWRKVGEYGAVQGDNMNPWSSNKGAKISTYRWSEIQAMVLGTTYLQGAIENHKKFAIHSVEDPGAYLSDKAAVSSPGDLYEMKNPIKLAFIWNEIRPVIEELGCLGEDRCYGRAVSEYLSEACPAIPEEILADPYNRDNYKWLAKNISEDAESPVFEAPAEEVIESPADPDQETIEEEKPNQSVLCENVPESKRTMVLKYFDSTGFGGDQHGVFIKKYLDLTAPNASAIITHLAEGRRQDPQNWTEFQILKLGGLDIEGMSFIHGVGLGKNDFAHMAEKNMGLVWSPYSNFLLYGETMDIEAAYDAGVTIALGSDWTPTGSKGVLDELKLARNYLAREGLYPGKIGDRQLYEMVTKNAARIIRHEGEVGTLAPGAMGSIIAVRTTVNHAYRNIVEHAVVEDVNLVVVDGFPAYGNKSYIEQWDLEADYDVLSDRHFLAELEKNPELFPYKRGKKGKKAASDLEILEKAKLHELTARPMPVEMDRTEVTEEQWNRNEALKFRCNFLEPKVMVYQGESFDFAKEGKVSDLLADSGVNLDRFDGIARYLGVALLSQGHNISYTEEAGLSINKNAVRQLPPIFGCDDKTYTERFLSMAQPNGHDEIARNASNRLARRVLQGLVSTPAKEKPHSPFGLANLLQIPTTSVVATGANGEDVVVEVLVDFLSNEYQGLASELGLLD